MNAALDAYLDHLAVAAESWDELWPRYRTDLGGAWVSGGPSAGFASAQVRFRNGMKVEALAPEDWEQNDFLRRFLDRRGPGAHHLTFKVPDIRAAIAASEAAGYRPVGIDLRDEFWQEMFLHPKDAPGVVIQLAQSAGEWDTAAPPSFPPARADAASLDYVGHAVARFDHGVRLFGALLNGAESGRGRDALLDADWIEFAWKGGGAVRVFEMPTWLGDEAGRLHHVGFTTVAPQDVPDAKPTGDGRYEVVAEANLGVRLLLSDVAA